MYAKKKESPKTLFLCGNTHYLGFSYPKSCIPAELFTFGKSVTISDNLKRLAVYKRIAINKVLNI